LFARPWFRLLVGIAVLQVAGALAGFTLGDPEASSAFAETAFPARFFVVPLLVFAAGGTLLLVTGRRDVRAVRLGLFFLLLATPFTNRWLLLLVESTPRPVALPAAMLRSLQVDSFFAWVFWLFAHDFPQAPTSRRVRRLLTWGGRAALVAGFVLAGKELVRLALALRAASGGALPASIALPKPSYKHYALLMLLTIAALVTLLWRARRSVGAERRRVSLFALAMVVGLTPLFSQIALGFIDRYSTWLEQPQVLRIVGPVVFAFLFTLPFTTAYAVLVHHVLDVKLLARQAVQYALARNSALALISLPVIVLPLYFYLQSERPVGELVSGNRLLLLLGVVAAGVVSLRYRRSFLDSIDRRFFREQFDARLILTELVDNLRAVADAPEVAELICREVDRALHLDSAAVLVEDPRSGTFADPQARTRRRLDGTSQLAHLVADSSQPLDTELEGRPSPVTRLPEEDRRWLAEQGVRLIAPIPARDGTLLGLMLLGAKRSGLPFLKEDRQLLRDIASSAAMGLELSRIRAEAAQPVPAEKGGNGRPAPAAAPTAAENARECPNCGRVFPSYTVFCSHCSRRLEPAHIPYVLPPNRFRFERRIGAGGMGVVYRASDLSLGRPVAIKTLRKVSPDHALRLRREARTAAAVVHPHLGSIYGVDTWQGTPMLILELLEGGTLGQRIEKAVLPPLETVELGIAMAGALERLHGADILHRDVKPNNIGYTRDGVPKLMDFGIARMTLDSRTEPNTTSATDASGWLEVDDQVATWVWGVPGDVRTQSRQLVGTLSYLSPEALEGQSAAESFDLWSLAVVLYECLIGRKLFRGEEIKQVMSRILMGRVPELTDVRPDAPELLARFFRTALHRDLDRRPPTATALRGKLQEVRAELAGDSRPS
jgi:hypothetical protein